MQQVNNFDLIRLIAALQVAVVHGVNHLQVTYAPTISGMLNVVPGVPVFFLISGFLIFQSFRNSGSLQSYARNRVLRIYPALYVCFALSVAMVIVVGYLPLSTLGTGQFAVWSLGQLSFVQFYNPDMMRDFGAGVLNGSLWTISVELQFYVLVPLLSWIVTRASWAWMPLIIGFASVNVGLLWFDDGSLLAKLVTVSFTPWFYMFLIGAWLSTKPAIIDQIRAAPFGLVLGAFAVTAGLTQLAGLPVGTNDINPLMFIALALLVVKLAFAMSPLGVLLEKKLRRRDISYGIYIYHMPVINLLLYLGLLGAGAMIGAVGTAITLAILSMLLVERPALALKRRTLRTAPAGTIAPRIAPAAPEQDIAESPSAAR